MNQPDHRILGDKQIPPRDLNISPWGTALNLQCSHLLTPISSLRLLPSSAWNPAGLPTALRTMPKPSSQPQGMWPAHAGPGTGDHPSSNSLQTLASQPRVPPWPHGWALPSVPPSGPWLHVLPAPLPWPLQFCRTPVSTYGLWLSHEKTPDTVWNIDAAKSLNSGPAFINN